MGLPHHLSKALALLLFLPTLVNAAKAPTGLLCELMEHPEQTVITTATPEFGWIYNPSFRNDSQAAYRIIVASSQTLAIQGTGDFWDSGVVSNSASLNIAYAGASLQPNTDYFWCVQTVDSASQGSPFSSVQHFHTDTQLASPPVLPVTTNGLQWIWYPESPASTSATRYFRKAFAVPANPGVAGAQILLTADDHFTLYVNGTLVGTTTANNSWKQFNLYPLNSLVQVGTNVIAIAVTNSSGTAGLTGRLDYRGTDGSTNTVFIDGTWLASSNLVANWNQPGFNDSSWSNALVEGGYGVSPWNTTAALPPATGLYYNASTNLFANRYPLAFASVTPVLLTNTAPGRWFADFGQDAFGSATVHLNGAFNGTKVHARFGEMASGNAVNTSPPSGSTVRYAATSFTLQNGNFIYSVQPPAFSGQTISPPANYGVVMPFRYFELTNIPGTLTVTDVVQQVLLDQFNTNAASFSSSSTPLNQIWNLCRNSVRALTFDGIYVDGDRERKPYESDSYIHQLSSYAVDREFTLPRYSFEYLLTHPTWPTEWKFHMIFFAWADYLQTGNTDLLNAYYDALKPDTFTWAATGNGLMVGFPNFAQTTNSDIVDWPAADRDGFVISSGSYLNWTNSVNNAFYYRCLQIMANMASVIGRTNDATNYTAMAAQVYTNYNVTFWNGSSYIDGVGTTHSSAHANFFPLAFGLVPASNQTAVVNYLHSRIAANSGMPPSVYGAQYFLEALFNAGDGGTALGLMTTNGPRGWLNMINLGSTLTDEAWNFTDKPNEDWNHAWGAAAGNLIERFVLGLRPITAGYGQVLIQPQLGQTVSFVQGTIPTVRGPVSIQASNAPGQFQLLLNLPGNVSATVMIPTWGATQAVALVDGNMVSGLITNNFLTVTNIGSGQHAIWLNTNNVPTAAALFNNWTASWFGANATNTLLAGPDADPDGDGLSNYNEFVAGTNPLDASDRFGIVNFNYTVAGSSVGVTIVGHTGRHYALQHTSRLYPATWFTSDTQTAGSDGQTITLHYATVSGMNQCFLRVMVTSP